MYGLLYDCIRPAAKRFACAVLVVRRRDYQPPVERLARTSSYLTGNGRGGHGEFWGVVGELEDVVGGMEGDGGRTEEDSY